MQDSRWLIALLLAASALAFVALRLPFSSMPLERDEGEYAYIAQRALQGEVPYRDAFDQKPPLVFALYALAFEVAGERVASIRGLVSLWLGLSALGVFACGRRISGPVGGGVAALCFCVAAAAPSVLGHTANTEMFMCLPSIALLWLLLRAPERSGDGRWLASGALLAAACWLKPVAVVQVLLIVASAARILAARAPGGTFRQASRIALSCAAGAALASLPVLGWFALRGGFAEFVDAVILHNLEYTGVISLAQGVAFLRAAMATQTPTFLPIWALAVVGLMPALGGGTDSRGLADRRLLALWLVTAFLGIAIGLNFRPHYFFQWLPPLAVLAGRGGALLLAAVASRAPRGLPAAALAGVLLIVAPSVIANHELLWSSDDRERTRALYGLNPFAESAEIGAWIRENSAPADRVFVMGSEPQILFHAGRRSASRYIFTYPLLGDFRDAGRRQREAMDEILETRPRCIVWVRIATSQLSSPRSPRTLPKELGALIARDYVLGALWVPDPDVGGYRALLEEEARRHAEDPSQSYRRRVSVEVFHLRGATETESLGLDQREG